MVGRTSGRVIYFCISSPHIRSLLTRTCIRAYVPRGAIAPNRYTGCILPTSGIAHSPLQKSHKCSRLIGQIMQRTGFCEHTRAVHLLLTQFGFRWFLAIDVPDRQFPASPKVCTHVTIFFVTPRRLVVEDLIIRSVVVVHPISAIPEFCLVNPTKSTALSIRRQARGGSTALKRTGNSITLRRTLSG